MFQHKACLLSHEKHKRKHNTPGTTQTTVSIVFSEDGVCCSLHLHAQGGTADTCMRRAGRRHCIMFVAKDEQIGAAEAWEAAHVSKDPPQLAPTAEREHTGENVVKLENLFGKTTKGLAEPKSQGTAGAGEASVQGAERAEGAGAGAAEDTEAAKRMRSPPTAASTKQRKKSTSQGQKEKPAARKRAPGKDKAGGSGGGAGDEMAGDEEGEPLASLVRRSPRQRKLMVLAEAGVGRRTEVEARGTDKFAAQAQKLVGSKKGECIGAKQNVELPLKGSVNDNESRSCSGGA